MIQEGWGGCHKEEWSHPCKMAPGAKQAGARNFSKTRWGFCFYLKVKGKPLSTLSQWEV